MVMSGTSLIIAWLNQAWPTVEYDANNNNNIIKITNISQWDNQCCPAKKDKIGKILTVFCHICLHASLAVNLLGSASSNDVSSSFVTTREKNKAVEKMHKIEKMLAYKIIKIFSIVHTYKYISIDETIFVLLLLYEIVIFVQCQTQYQQGMWQTGSGFLNFPVFWKQLKI